jgi:hypothetical protein
VARVAAATPTTQSWSSSRQTPGTRAPAFAAPRPSPHRMNVAGALPAVVAVAVHAHPVVNYPATAGALAMLRAAASVQPDFVTSTSLLSHSAPEHRRQRHSPLSVADPRQPRLGCPHRGNIGDLRAHMVVVREAWAFIDACQAVEPLHRRIDPRRHITYARWQQQTLMHHLSVICTTTFTRRHACSWMRTAWIGSWGGRSRGATR